MRFHIEMPIENGCGERDSMAAIARAAEKAGFDGLAYTDHPAPSRKWLDSGGHLTYDPFPALAFCAAITTRVRLLTYLAVLPYRNPLLLAKSVATVDRLSAGRLTLVVGSGYLRSEFLALGRSFDDRNAQVDEALAVLTRVWSTPSFQYEGADFTALAVTSEPRPVQMPHPPIWIGGNSRRSRDRVVRYGAGWAPLITTGAFAQTVRTSEIGSFDQLRDNIVDLRHRARAAGRDPESIGVQTDLGNISDVVSQPDLFSDQVEELSGIGVSDIMLRPTGGGGVAAVVDQLGAVARVIGQHRRPA